MSNEVNNPYKIEEELTSMIKDVKEYNNNNGVLYSRILSKEQFTEFMKGKYEYLYKSSEGLFTKCLANEFRDKRNLKRIEEMLHHLKRIYNGSVSREAVDQQLGAKYAKEYVDPLVNKMDADKKIEFK